MPGLSLKLGLSYMLSWTLSYVSGDIMWDYDSACLACIVCKPHSVAMLLLRGLCPQGNFWKITFLRLYPEAVLMENHEAIKLMVDG